MKILVAVAGLCLSAAGQAVYSGAGHYAGVAAHGTPVCGPPNYSCFSMSTAAVPLPNPIPSWGANSCDNTSPYTMQNCGNLAGAGSVRTPTDFGNAVARCTDAGFVDASHYWLTADNGEPNLFAPDDSGIVLKTNGGTRYLAAFNPTTMQCSLSGISYSNTPAIWDHASATTVYTLGGTYGTTLNSNLVNLPGGMSTPTLLYDFRNANCLQNSYNGTASWGSSGWIGIFTSSLDDSTFSVGFGTPGMNGQGVYVATWKKSYGQNGGCDILNTTTGLVRVHDGTQMGAITNTDRFYIHEVFSALNNSYAVVSTGGQGQMLNGTYVSGYYFWQIGTTNLMHCGVAGTGGYYCDGHAAEGYLYEAVGSKTTLHGYADPSWPLTQLNSAGSCNNTHSSWNHDNATDSWPVLVKGQEVGAAVNLVGGATPPCAYYDEIWLARTDGGGVARAAHTFNSGWSPQFGVQNSIAVQSSSGKFAVWTTDGWGQFGSTSGAASCHIGGPDWAKNDSTDFTNPGGSGFGSYVLPLSGNSGDYIFQVQVCAGYPTTACTTGGTEPDWNSHQTSGATVADNTITWVNTGNTADCRSEDMVVKLTR